MRKISRLKGKVDGFKDIENLMLRSYVARLYVGSILYVLILAQFK